MIGVFLAGMLVGMVIQTLLYIAVEYRLSHFKREKEVTV